MGKTRAQDSAEKSAATPRKSAQAGVERPIAKRLSTTRASSKKSSSTGKPMSSTPSDQDQQPQSPVRVDSDDVTRGRRPGLYHFKLIDGKAIPQRIPSPDSSFKPRRPPAKQPPPKQLSLEEWRSAADRGMRLQEYIKKLLQLKKLLEDDSLNDIARTLEEAERQLYHKRMTWQDPPKEIDRGFFPLDEKTLARIAAGERVEELDKAFEKPLISTGIGLFGGSVNIPSEPPATPELEPARGIHQAIKATTYQGHVGVGLDEALE